MTPPKNLAASIYGRLKNKAKQDRRNFQDVLLHYGIERFLYRLCQSEHADSFILKGGLAFMSFDAAFPRATRDIDLLGHGDHSQAHLETVVRDICRIPIHPDDALTFELDSIKSETILEQNDYSGVRLKLVGMLIRSRIPLQIDVGYGDAVHPPATQITYPVLLAGQPEPTLRAYPLETMLAEKIHIITSLDLFNSRLKDFYDLWFVSERHMVDGAQLVETVQQTFARRGTEVPDGFRDHFFAEFYQERAVQWTGLQKRIRERSLFPPFDAALLSVETFAQPVLKAAHRRQSFERYWEPRRGWIEQN